MPLSPNQYKQQFITSSLAATIKDELEDMEQDAAYYTQTSYSAMQECDVTFTEKHYTYMSTHPSVKPNEYMSNLRLMTKVRTYAS